MTEPVTINAADVINEVTIPVRLQLGIADTFHVADLVLPYPVVGTAWRTDLADLLRAVAVGIENGSDDISVSSDAARWTPAAQAEANRHWVTRYDPDDGEPYGSVCDCEIGEDHDGGAA